MHASSSDNVASRRSPRREAVSASALGSPFSVRTTRWRETSTAVTRQTAENFEHARSAKSATMSPSCSSTLPHEPIALPSARTSFTRAIIQQLYAHFQNGGAWGWCGVSSEVVAEERRCSQPPLSYSLLALGCVRLSLLRLHSPQLRRRARACTLGAARPPRPSTVASSPAHSRACNGRQRGASAVPGRRSTLRRRTGRGYLRISCARRIATSPARTSCTVTGALRCWG